MAGGYHGRIGVANDGTLLAADADGRTVALLLAVCQWSIERPYGARL